MFKFNDEEDVFERMDLNFFDNKEETDKEEINKEEVEKTSTTKEKIIENKDHNYVLTEEIEDKKGIETLNKKPSWKEYKKIEKSNKKRDKLRKINENKVLKNKKKTAQNSLLISIFWFFILFLSTISFIESSFLIADQISEFAEHIGYDMEWQELLYDYNLISDFIKILFTFLELFLFTFFIIFSIFTGRKKLNPYLNWRLETEPERVEKKIFKLESKNEILKDRISFLRTNYKKRKVSELVIKQRSKEYLRFLKRENKDIDKAIKKYLRKSKKRKKR
ncbi:MAG: hypothetical protein TYPL_0040 [Candidatus Tyloplasma litorale]|nr:MAG: hypothetical protein TYPL_0040 [Mycoplasmatales bacterium]